MMDNLFIRIETDPTQYTLCAGSLSIGGLEGGECASFYVSVHCAMLALLGPDPGSAAQKEGTPFLPNSANETCYFLRVVFSTSVTGLPALAGGTFPVEI